MPYKDLEIRKIKHRVYSRKHYEANKKQVQEKTKNRKKNLRDQWIEFKENISCARCGLAHPAVIDFHHVSPSPSDRKLFEILRCNNFSAALEEIKKCIPLCANCHRIHHHEERAKKLEDIKKTPPCERG